MMDTVIGILGIILTLAVVGTIMVAILGKALDKQYGPTDWEDREE